MRLSDSFKFVFAVFLAFSLVTCGGSGGGDDDDEFKTGVFRDTAVGGLSYVSGGTSGETSSDGGFIYENGKSVTFSIGGVVIGTSTGRGVITPVDLVSGASSSTTAVLNIVRFLLMLDSNGNSTGGINISSEVRAAAENWSQVDFNAADFMTEVASIIADASAADNFTHTLPDATTAQAHLESTLLCTRAGGYRGRYRGDDTGPFGVLVDANSGLLSGFAYSEGDDELLTLTGSNSISLDQNANFISGDVNTGATFTGQFDGPDDLSGTWALSPDDGTFSGSRIGGLNSAVLRYTGSFTGDSFGVFTFDVDGANNVSGVAYTVLASSDGTTDELSSFSGTLTGSSLNATIIDDGIVAATITGTLNTGSGTVSGTWTDIDNNVGTFSGSGCSLI